MVVHRDNHTDTSTRLGVIPRLLLSRVEIWLVLLILLIGCLLAIGFGAAVLDAERQKHRLGRVRRRLWQSRRYLTPSNGCCPATTKCAFGEQPRRVATGWIFPSGPMTGPGGYILLSRYDGSENCHKLELVSLPSMRTVYSWRLSAAELLKDVSHISRFANQTTGTRLISVKFTLGWRRMVI